jgi:hypothetical protein
MKSSTSSSGSSGATYPLGFGYLDSASATTFFLPGTCLISKSYMRMAPSYRFITAPGTSADDRLSCAMSVCALVLITKCWLYS